MRYCADCYQLQEAVCKCNHLMFASIPASGGNHVICMRCVELDPGQVSIQIEDARNIDKKVDLHPYQDPVQAKPQKRKPVADQGDKLNSTPYSSSPAGRATIVIEHFPSTMASEPMLQKGMFQACKTTSRKRSKQAHHPKVRMVSKQPEPTVSFPIRKRHSHLAAEVLHCSPKDAFLSRRSGMTTTNTCPSSHHPIYLKQTVPDVMCSELLLFKSI